jgi:hypothetical protein
MTLTFEKTELVPDIHWVASLSDGTLVYQDKNPDRSCWAELKKHVKENNLKIMNLMVEKQKPIIKCLPFLDKNLNKQTRGYWFSQKAMSMIGAAGQNSVWFGVGYVIEDKIYISWLLPNGNINHEIRSVGTNNPAIIWNE